MESIPSLLLALIIQWYDPFVDTSLINIAVSVVSGRLTDMISLLSDSHTTLTLSNDRPPVCVNIHDINSESEDNTPSVEELNTGSTYIYRYQNYAPSISCSSIYTIIDYIVHNGTV